jgi:hypothetical protein
MPSEEALAVLESTSTCQSKSWPMSISSRTVNILFDRVDQISETDAVDGGNAAAAAAADDSIVADDDNTDNDAGGGGDDYDGLTMCVER